MSPSILEKRKIAVRVADTLNSIEGAPVSDKAKKLALQWSRGEITGEHMKSAIIAMHTPHEYYENQSGI